MENTSMYLKRRVKAKQKKALPRTGGAATVWYYAAGIGLVLMAGFTFRKRKDEEI